MRYIKSILLILLFHCHVSSHAQQFELGIGVAHPGLDWFGLNLHSFVGYAFTRKFVLGLSIDYNKFPNTRIEHDRVIDWGSWNRPKIVDTFYNVVETNRRSLFEIALEPRFYSSPSYSRIFFCPSIGLGVFRQENNFTKLDVDYEQAGVFTRLKPSIGIEFGFEFQLYRKKPVSLQLNVSSKYYQGFFATDIYIPEFTGSSMLAFKGRLALVWRMGASRQAQ